MKSEPVLLTHHGRMLEHALRKELVTESEVWAAVRSEGVARASKVEAVILETDGSFSIIHADPGSLVDTLKNVNTGRDDEQALFR